MAIKFGNVVFYEIPKTGCVFVRKVLCELGIPHEILVPLRPTCGQHSPWWCYQDADFKVCAIRHPISWYESYWKFHHKEFIGYEKGIWFPHLNLHLGDEKLSRNFSDWIIRVIERFPGYYTRLVETFIGSLDHPIMNRILKTETLSLGLSNLLSELGYDIDKTKLLSLPKENVRTKRLIWPAGTRKQILYLERNLIERFYR